MIVKPEYFDSLLPFGEGLKAIVNSSSISESNLNTVLKGRGVFLQSANGNVNSIEYLVSSLLSPREFDYLREKQSYKEDKQKRSTKIIKIEGDDSLVDMLPDINELPSLPLKEFCNYKPSGAYSFIYNGGNKATVEIPIEILDTSKNWASSKSVYNVKIEFEKQENKLIINTTSTAPETREVAEMFTKQVVVKLKEGGHILQQEDFEKIVFSSFESNQKRIVFFLSLTRTEGHQGVTFSDVSKIGIIPATDQSLPEAIDWMATTNNLQLDGAELHKIFFIDNNDYAPYMNFYKLSANYSFSNHFSEGVAQVVFEFPRYLSTHDDSTEFEVKISSISLTDNYKDANKKNVESWLLNKMAKLKMSKFEKMKRSSDQEGS